MKLFSTIALCLLFFNSGCVNPKAQEQADSKDSVQNVTTTVAPDFDALSGDEIRAMGILKKVEDSGYPFAVLEIEFPKEKFSESFVINLEEVRGMNMAALSASIGSYVSFKYTTKLIKALLDVQLDGKSLVNEKNIEQTPEMKDIIGLMQCPNQVSGDLPGIIKFKGDNDEPYEFEFFITQELIDANGKEVVMIYEERAKNTITAIKALPKD